MPAINWLHLTDLHRGMHDQDHLLPAVRQQFFDDLARLSEIAGPFDLVLFTGDLVQTGAAHEFDRLNELLDRLFSHLERLGTRPVLLPVPGNHDLIRPKVSAVVRALRRFHDERDLQAEFFRDPTCEYRALIDEAFLPYTQWLAEWQRAHPPPQGIEIRHNPGLLPGDFSATVAKNGARIGIVGLNSAYLQLTSDNYESRLHLDPRQFHAACKGDGPDWLVRHHINLLLTHHPPEWLHVGSLSQFRAEIAQPGWFEAHLFGHMHEPNAAFQNLGGARTERRIQGASLFGLETFGDGTQQRLHGYIALRAEIERGKGKLSIFPRIAIMARAGYRKLVPDNTFDLDAQGAFHADLHIRPVIPSRPPPPSGPPNRLDVPLQDPGGPYDPRWYVNREEPERQALTLLRQRGQPVAVWGPELFGKRWILRYLLDQLKSTEPELRIALVNLRLMGGDTMSSIGTFLEELGAQILEALGLDEELLTRAFSRPGTPSKKLTRLLSHEILPTAPGPLIVAIDQADALWRRDWCDDFFDLLRGWTDRAEQEPWSQLRLLVTMSTTPVLMTKSINRSPFANIASHVSLTDFDIAQVTRLAGMHGLSLGEDKIKLIMDRVGGHPFLLRLVMVKAARDGIPIEELLADEHPLFVPFLDRVRFHLSKSPGVAEALRAIVRDPRASIETDALLRLQRAGLLCEAEHGYRLRYRLYERLHDNGHRLRS